MSANPVAVAVPTEAAIETVAACDLCGHAGFRHERTWNDPLLFGPETWNLVRCESCSLHFINPRPTPGDIGRFYPTDYGAFTAKPSEPKAWHRRISAKDAAPLSTLESVWMHVRQSVSWYRFPAWHGEGHVLDIGCGSGGRYLDILKGLGWTTHGMDPAPNAIEAAKAKGHDAVVGIAEDTHFGDSTMDVVTMWHVLEHTHSPTQALASCHRMLRPGGQLSLCVPNWGSLQAKVYGRWWWSCDAPRHLYQFTRPTLRRFVEQAGFEITMMTTRTGATSYQRAFRHLLNSMLGTKWQKDSSLAVTLADPWVAFASLFRFLGVGSEIRLVATKL
jgi:2-polyprenyl-3-methyl-5-hydroxy-6-metoxy-1,4-benzoquinol methylase